MFDNALEKENNINIRQKKYYNLIQMSEQIKKYVNRITKLNGEKKSF